MLHYFPERTNFFLKQERRRDLKEKSTAKKVKSSEQQNDKEQNKWRERLSSTENGEDRPKRKEKKASKAKSYSRSRSRERQVLLMFLV